LLRVFFRPRLPVRALPFPDSAARLFAVFGFMTE
jgi:hypothetical protein